MSTTESKASESKDSGVNIKVVVRCRPLNSAEKEEGTPSVVHVTPGRNELAVRGSLKRPKTYTFDKVYGQYSTQEEVFKEQIVPTINEALQGFNCTVFAYGQTGTGKTYTMEGDLGAGPNAGIIPRSLNMIFDHLKKNATEYSVRLSFLELYNEQLADLMFMANEDIEALKRGGRAPGAGGDTPVSRDDHRLRIVDDSRKGTVVDGLEEVLVHDAEDAFDHLRRAVSRRHVAETILNKASSRSHSIFTITIHTKETTPDGEDLLKVGKLNLVDLAGSECIGRSGAKKDRAREAGNINQSLLTLGRVITALVDHLPHVPYRDSKLTRLLQDSLGGKTKTCIVATLSPSVVCVDETVSTLDYASRAKNIKNRPVLNQKMTKRALIKEYSQEIERLKEELKCARDKHGVYLPTDKYEQMQLQLASQTGSIAELEAVMESHTKAKEALEAENAAVAAAFEAAAADVTLLHDKIDRKAAVEEANKEEAGAYVTEGDTRLDILSSTVVEFKARQRQELDTLAASIDGLMGRREEETATLTQCVDSITTAVDGFVDGTVAATGAFVEAGTAECEGVSASVATFSAAFADLMATSGTAIKAELGTLSDLIARQQAQLEEWAKFGAAFAASVTAGTEAFVEQHATAVTACETAIDAKVQELEQAVECQRAAVAAATTKRKAATKAATEQLAAALEAFASAQEEAADEDAAAAEAAVQATADAIPGVRAGVLEAVTGVAGVAADYVASVVADVDAHTEAASAKQADMSACLDQGEAVRASVSSTIDSTLEKAAADVASSMTEFEGVAQAAQARLTAFTTDLTTNVGAARDTVGANADRVKGVIQDGQEAFRGACEAAKGKAEAGAANVDSLVTGSSAWVDDGRSAASHYLHDRLKVDVPTGTTPVKREYKVERAATAEEGCEA